MAFWSSHLSLLLQSAGSPQVQRAQSFMLATLPALLEALHVLHWSQATPSVGLRVNWTRKAVSIDSNSYFPKMFRCSIFFNPPNFPFFIISIKVIGISCCSSVKCQSFLLVPLPYDPLSVGLQIFS